MWPGYVDCHVHVLGAARASSAVDVSDATSVEQLLLRIAGAQGEGWVRAWGYDDFLTSRHPEPSELLRASGGRPVRLVHRTGHVVVATQPGRPPRPPSESIVSDATDFLNELRCRGVTGVVDASGYDDQESVELVRVAAARAKVAAEVLVGPTLISSAQAGVKVRRPPRDWRELLSLAQRCRRRDLLLAVHVVEAHEIESMISLAEASLARIRVEHVGMLFDGQAERMAKAHVDAVVQPGLIRIRGDAYLARFPRALWPYLHPLRRLLEAGVRVGFSSDAPVTPSDPRQWIAASVSRRARSGRLVAPYEAIGRRAAEALARDSMGVSSL